MFINVHVFRARHRHVMLPKDIAKLVPKNRLMTEMEWRSIGIQQSQGWIHYMVHGPGMYNNLVMAMLINTPVPSEPHIILFRRPSMKCS